MGIQFYDNERVFKLDTPKSTYMFKIADEEQFILHLYYGRRLSDERVADLCRNREWPLLPSQNNRERCSFYDFTLFEYPCHGLGDYRDDAFRVLNKNGHSATSLFYRSHKIFKGKKKLDGLPATFGSEEDCTTLEVECEDTPNSLRIILSYTVFEKIDAITKSVRFINEGSEDIKLTKAMSMCTELPGSEYDTITLHGSWARERMIDRNRLSHGKHYVSSKRGESSHQEHPFIALMEPSATEDSGEVYGFNFVYSGNFIAQAELSQFESVRVLMGINPEDFSWKLSSKEEFTTPEVVSVFSYEGIGGMTRTFHDLYREHLIRSPYKNKRRPVLINNWEATYFDFDTDKLISIAKEASRLGIEMLVMDDGWFGKRKDDNSSLGDWTVNTDKLKGGLKPLVDEVNRLGMKFGIWMEPEMVSVDSELYRAHPDWAIHIPGRVASQSRAQYVLDLSNPEVVDHIYAQVKAVLDSANIEYVKWDMNRQLTDVGSAYLSADAQGELFHRYVLGMYSLQERLITEYPNLLLENCSGGGARFDAGMLYYCPQIWCSDDADAIERLKIQQGTALIYPLSTMGAHVSDCPNHTVGRVTPFETRGIVALAGTFGYELDVTRIPEKDREMIPAQVACFKKYTDLVRNGDYYRIKSYVNGDDFDSWMIVSKDKSEALLTVVEVLHRPNYKSRRIRLKGLDAGTNYRVIYENGGNPAKEDEISLNGDSLMYAGINVGGFVGDFGAKLVHIIKA